MENSNKKSKFSLKIKLIAMNIGLLLMLGIGSLGVLNHLVTLEMDSQKKSFESYADNLSDAISAQFFERYGDVQAFAVNPSVLSPNKQVAVDMLNTFSSLYGIYDLIMILDTKGKLLAVNSKDPSGASIKVDALYEKNYSDSPWFKAVMAGTFHEDKEKGFSGTFVEDPQIDPWISQVYGGNRLGSSFSAPIKDASGKTIGVVSNRAGARWFEVAFKEIYDNLKKIGDGKSSLIFFGKDGTLFYEYVPNPNSNKNEDLGYNWERLLKTNLIKDGNELAKKAAIQREFGSDNSNGFVTGFGPVDNKKFVNSLGWGVMVKEDEAQAFDNINEAKHIFYIVFSIMMLFAVALAFWYSSSLSRLLIKFADHLAKSGSEVATAANQISSSSNELSEASQEQASAIQETAASIDEVSAMVKKNSENAAQSQITSEKNRSSAEKGQESVQKVIQSISDISESNVQIMNQVSDGNKKISEIVSLISEIGNKTKVINDIVFQTKLLSFNASVEAARAGEHGKGFAVVAEEVGNLAQMSGNAAKEISSLLDGSIQKVEGIINETKSSVEKLVVESKAKVELGMNTARECGDNLTEILSSVQELDVMVAEISLASKEQSQGVEEINKAMNQLDQVTQKNTSVSQQSASAALQLSNQSQDLQAIVNDLYFLVSGESVNSKTVHAKTPKKKVEKVAKILKFKSKKEVQKNVQLDQKSMDEKIAPVVVKKAVGAIDVVPNFDDTRFEDV